MLAHTTTVICKVQACFLKVEYHADDYTCLNGRSWNNITKYNAVIMVIPKPAEKTCVLNGPSC